MDFSVECFEAGVADDLLYPSGRYVFIVDAKCEGVFVLSVDTIVPCLLAGFKKCGGESFRCWDGPFMLPLSDLCSHGKRLNWASLHVKVREREFDELTDAKASI